CQRGVAYLVVAAFEIGTLVVEEAADDLDRLLQHPETLRSRVERDVVGGVLVLLPARAKAQDGAAAADDIDLRDLLGEDGRVAVGVAGHERAETDVGHGRCQRREHGPDLLRRPEVVLPVGHEVVSYPDAAPAALRQVLRFIKETRPWRCRSEPSAELHFLTPWFV